MTKTIREQLQALVDSLRKHADKQPDEDWLFAEGLHSAAQRIESILATEEQEVRVRKGWVCKDSTGTWWYSDKPFWDTSCEWWDNNGAMHQLLEGAITDPWETSHPNGGPDCVMEVV